jgi:putative SOS response-associated peptidase YedK
MCGRYASSSSLTDLAEVFEVEEVRTEPLPLRYNVAPTLDVYAVAIRGRTDRVKGPRRALGTFRWGLVPSWAKDPSVGSRMINARSEGLDEKPAYRAALERRRCLIPADAFYEWQRRSRSDGSPAGTLPHVIHRRDGQPMAFAGLWEVWRPPSATGTASLGPDGLLSTCAIVTTSANDLLAPVHHRMPVVLAPGDWGTWLDPASPPAAVKDLLVPAPSSWFDLYPVSTLVNNVRNDGPELLDPLPPAPVRS